MSNTRQHFRRRLGIRLASGVLCAAGLGLSACTSLEQAAPPVALLRPANQTPACSRGREIYITKCTKCHRAEPIRKFSAEEWDTDIMPTMVKKSKLVPSDAAAVQAYVKAVLSSPPPPPKS